MNRTIGGLTDSKAICTSYFERGGGIIKEFSCEKWKPIILDEKVKLREHFQKALFKDKILQILPSFIDRKTVSFFLVFFWKFRFLNIHLWIDWCCVLYNLCRLVTFFYSEQNFFLHSSTSFFSLYSSQKAHRGSPTASPIAVDCSLESASLVAVDCSLESE